MRVGDEIDEIQDEYDERLGGEETSIASRAIRTKYVYVVNTSKHSRNETVRDNKTQVRPREKEARR